MKITVQYFSYLRELTGTSEQIVNLPDNTSVGDLLATLYRQHGRLGETDRSLLIAVGVEFAARDTILRDRDVVSLMPPVQGGVDADECLITTDPIDPAEAEPVGLSHDTGGVVIFWGVVRDIENGQSIRALDYSAYREMAEHQFRKLLADTRDRWPLKRIRLVHRLGAVPAGEASLLVRVEAEHRAEAFAAAQHIIEELKKKVPIWKQPVG
jgi:molybdopterin synthase catalytic subunit/molybdopterin converting factor small subunit